LLLKKQLQKKHKLQREEQRRREMKRLSLLPLAQMKKSSF
jgi:hypothetical protein